MFVALRGLGQHIARLNRGPQRFTIMVMDAKIEAARRQMIDQQVRTWEVLDPRVLDTLAAVPRERFVPEAYRGVAFADAPIPIGHGQWMLPPALEGRILQALAPVRGERVLEIGTGSGFFAACLAHLTGTVDSLEIHADLAAGAARAIETQGISRVSIEAADALARDYDGTYQVVAVTGSVPALERRIERALAVGGRMFVVVGTGRVMEARLVTRTGEESWLSEALFETRIEPLVLPSPPSRFQF
jgi:protein-L-isoaspartate(D-aspartate) O-methyltransferase